MQNEATLKKHVTKLRVVMRDLVDDILGSDPGSLSLQDSVGDLQHPPLGNPHHRVGHKPQNSIILEGNKVQHWVQVYSKKWLLKNVSHRGLLLLESI